MARRFRGEHDTKIDGKGRVSIPASFRKVIEGNDPDWVEGRPATLIVVLGNDRRRFLECYSVRAIEEVDAVIESMPRGSSERRAMEDFIYAKSETLLVDGTGRTVLPKKLRDKIGLGADTPLIFKGAGDTFQIWNAATFEKEQAAGIAEAFEALPADADPLVLLDRYREASR